VGFGRRLASIFRGREVAAGGTGPGLIFSLKSCLAARLSRRVGGDPRALGCPFWLAGLFRLVSRTGWPAGGRSRR
jgi:hypothetical protein